MVFDYIMTLLGSSLDFYHPEEKEQYQFKLEDSRKEISIRFY